MTRAGDLVGANGVRVLAQRCDTCVFFPGNRMQLEPGALAEIVKTNLARGTWLTCHTTLAIIAGYGRAAVCHGWVQAYGLGPTMEHMIELFGREDVTP